MATLLADILNGMGESELVEATRAFRRAEHTQEKRRLELAAAIADAAVDGVRQTDIVRITGYTREHIRRILRAEADRRSGPGNPF